MKRITAVPLLVLALCCALTPLSYVLAQDSVPPSPTQSPSPSPAQSAAVEAGAQNAAHAAYPEFRFVSTTKVSTMEKELNELAAEGFRLERVSKSLMDDNLAALVVREATAGGTRYEYRLVATRRVGTMEKEILEAAAQGYELRGLTPMFRPGLGMLIGDETTAVMERPVGESKPRFEYRLLSTRREKTMQKELDEAVAAGYMPVEMVRGQDNGAASLLLGPQFVNTIILARPVGAAVSTGTTREYRFLTTTKVGTMEREMNQAARQGFRFHMSAPDLLMLMSRERGAEGPARFEYKLLATRRTGTMQKELLEQVGLGYRYLATSNGLGGLTTVLERDLAAEAKGERREIKLLATTREKTTRREIVEALAEGYRILDLTTIGEFIVVLERKGTSANAQAN
jgi:RNA-binding protein YhbY